MELKDSKLAERLSERSPLPPRSFGEHEAKPTKQATKTAFSVLSYNISFDCNCWEERMDAIAAIITRFSPDVIALQEVTEKIYGRLQAHPFFLQYHWHPPDFSHAWYSTALGSKTPFSTTPQRRPYSKTTMRRDLTWAEIEIRSSEGVSVPVAIGNTHMESLKNEPTRQTQLREACSILEASDHAILCGDTNFMVREIGLPKGWADAWLSLGHAHWDGPTYDCVLNTMISHRGTNRARYDRFFFWTHPPPYSMEASSNADGTSKPSGAKEAEPRRLMIKNMRLVGTVPIKENIFPSDHFGLLAVFEL